jgi:hypothetical protein
MTKDDLPVTLGQFCVKQMINKEKFDAGSAPTAPFRNYGSIQIDLN